MKRLTLWLLAAAVGLPSAMQAQGLSMQMSNGWKFTFSGNVNAFLVYSADSKVGAVNGQKNVNIRTGLLPGFAVFEAKGREEGLDLGVHIGFAPQIQTVAQLHDFGAGFVAGAQIDMRQMYLTVGFKNGGQLLAGRELGVFGRQSIINDMTLYGTGALGGVQDGGTTLGRIGYGYIYPNFNSQFTYSTAPGKNYQLTVGLFQPSLMGDGAFDQLQTPRVEAEVTFNPRMSGRKTLTVWGGALWQTAKDAPSGGNSVTATGVTAGAKFTMPSGVAVTASAYTGKGLGTVLMFENGDDLTGLNENKSDGGYAQITYTKRKNTYGGSYGLSRLRDNNSNFIGQFSSYTVGWYRQWTRSLKLVIEGTREINDLGGGINTLGAGPNRTDVSAGLMLFF